MPIDEHLAAQRILAVTEEELQRIILNIHNGPVQKLFAALSQLNLLQAHARPGAAPDAEWFARLNRVSALLEASLAEIKTSLGTFRPPDVVVMDLQMPVLDGASCLAEIRKRELPVRVLVLTAFADGESIQSALEGGADGFALKTAPPRQTIEAIRQVGQGNLVFPPAARKWLRGHLHDPGPGLSEREWEVLEQVARGLTNPQIADALSVTENTVKFHLQNIFQKLNVSNRTEAAGYYFRVRGVKPSR